MSSNLRVAVRIRPTMPHDRKNGTSFPLRQLAAWPERHNPDQHFPRSVATINYPTLCRKNRPPQSTLYTGFSTVFGPDSSQLDVYNECGIPLVDAVLDGKNACIFAFGCTGGGKTHSMLGPEGGLGLGGQDSRNDAGILPRAAADLFRLIEGKHRNDATLAGSNLADNEYQVRVSFLEVYREMTFDLLPNDSRFVSKNRDLADSIPLRDAAEAGAFAEGANEETVTSVEQVLELVARGARARATTDTNVHAHSSRSHALLIITVEHRWREKADISNLGKDAKTGNRDYKSQTTRLVLVDLAGAEGMNQAHAGRVDSAGVATNLGLLVLTRVLTALADHSRNSSSKRNPSFAPFRDSTLTRLLQSSLDGGAVCQMLTCVSPNPHELSQTRQTLRYAQTAARIQQVVISTDIRSETELDVHRRLQELNPMVNDVDDPDGTMDRRTIWVQISNFGNVFARVVGDRRDPLILYIHGSGSQNSSMLWNDCAVEVNRGMEQISCRFVKEGQSPNKGRTFFHVAIDCPGYGRSPGDKQTIRSYPGEFIQNCITALGRKTVALLVGSSQGACAIFNALLEYPGLAQALAVCHPVGHDVKRYANIRTVPSLLVFDTEDRGHPVAVGRMMKRYLSQSKSLWGYYEFTKSRDGDWGSMNMAKLMIKMLLEVGGTSMQNASGAIGSDGMNIPHSLLKDRILIQTRGWGGRIDSLPELTRVAGGYNSWRQPQNREWTPWYGIGTEWDDPSGAAGDGAHDKYAASASILGKQNLADETQIATSVDRNGIKKNPRKSLFDDEGPASNLGEEIIGSLTALTSHEKESILRTIHLDQEFQREALTKQQFQKEANETDCSLCGQMLDLRSSLLADEHDKTLIPTNSFEWIRLVNCRCAICPCCVETTVRYYKNCPSCRSKIKMNKKGEVVNDRKDVPSKDHHVQNKGQHLNHGVDLCGENLGLDGNEKFKIGDRSNGGVIDETNVDRVRILDGNNINVNHDMGKDIIHSGTPNHNAYLRFSNQTATQQMLFLQQLQTSRDTASRLILEYGNVVTKSKPATKAKVANEVSKASSQKIEFTTFVREASREIGNNCRIGSFPPIARVEFNINPSFAKPTAVQKRSNDKKLGYSFNYAMTRSYPCIITIHFETLTIRKVTSETKVKVVKFPPLVIQYRVRNDITKRRIVLEIGCSAGEGPGLGNLGDAAFMANENPRDGWVKYFVGVGKYCTIKSVEYCGV